MDIEEFKLNVKTTIDDDPRETLLESVAYILAGAAWRDVPDDLKNRLVGPDLQVLFDAARPCLQRRDFATLDRHITQFRSNSTERINRERREGCLKPPSTAAEVKTHASSFSADHWRGAEIDAWQNMPAVREKIQAGHHLCKVTVRATQFDDGTIVSRAEVHRYALSQRPKFGDTISDDKFLEQFFTPERALLEIENARAITEREQIRKRTTYQSGPTSKIGTPIPVEQR